MSGGALQAAAGISQFDAEVAASGGDFTTIEAAFAAGNRSLLVSSSITEDTALAITADLYIYIQQNVTVTMGTTQWTLSASQDLVIQGEGNTSVLTWAASTAVPLIDGAATTWVCVDKIHLNNTTTTANADFTDSNQRITNCRLTPGNVNGAGLDCPSSTVLLLDNLELIGGGSSSGQIIKLAGGNCTINNVSSSGTFQAANSALISALGGRGSIDNWTHTGTAGAGISLRSDFTLSNATSADMDIACTASGNTIVNCNIGTGTVDPTNDSQLQISNCEMGTLDLTDASCDNVLVENCRVTNAITVAGDRHKFNNCDLLGGGSASSGALHNIFAGCQFGPDAGGGALTFTFDAGANTNILSGCISDAAIVDNGTSNVVADNIVY